MRKSRRLKGLSPLALKAEKALKKAVREVIEDHQRTGDPLAIWEKGRVRWVSAEKLLKRRK